jgi:hypothetical protein
MDSYRADERSYFHGSTGTIVTLTGMDESLDERHTSERSRAQLEELNSIYFNIGNLHTGTTYYDRIFITMRP